MRIVEKAENVGSRFPSLYHSKSHTILRPEMSGSEARRIAGFAAEAGDLGHRGISIFALSGLVFSKAGDCAFLVPSLHDVEIIAFSAKAAVGCF